jgi:ubiquinone/menaquinone biosynthesis C-methylase UbiE
MSHRVCPWWLGYWLVCPARRLGQNPHSILAPHVREGMMVLEPGPGMGFFTLELARLVGTAGRVIAIDVQDKMIDLLKRRAAKVGLLSRLDARIAAPDSLGVQDLDGMIDFTLAFAVVHEFPDHRHFFAEVAAASKRGAAVLLAEPKGHVKPEKFNSELEAASSAGFKIADHPPVRGSHTALLTKI